MYKYCLYMLSCGLFIPHAQAESLKDSFIGDTKVFVNIYGFAADIDGKIGYQGFWTIPHTTYFQFLQIFPSMSLQNQEHFQLCHLQLQQTQTIAFGIKTHI